MRVAIASRIFEPEPSAASIRLAALAAALAEAGHDVTVYTVRAPQGAVTQDTQDDTRAPYRVARFPVVRDRQGYVRGYVPYLSFDLPLVFRLLVARRFDVIVCEPPPTTGFMVRVVGALRRTPYVYYVADVWADATRQTGASSVVVNTLRAIERIAWGGAQLLLSVSEGVTQRVRNLAVNVPVHTIGNGVNTRPYTAISEEQSQLSDSLSFIYAGTASEWHGADMFIRALPGVLESIPEARLRFIGGGSQKHALESLAEALHVSHAVSFEPIMQPVELAPILARSAAAVASVRPGVGYDFAFPTKLYSAVACGTPLIYVGSGPAVGFVRQTVFDEPLGIAVDATIEQTTQAMIAAARAPFDRARRNSVARWASDAVSLDRVARLAVTHIEEVATR